MSIRNAKPSNKRWIGPRGRNIAHSGAWSLAAKATAAANLFLSVPFVLKALGPEQFGVWATLVSLVVFTGFLDFGLGNSTMNLVASAHGRGNYQEASSILSEARRALWTVAMAIAIAALVFVPFASWHKLLGLAPDMASASRISVTIVALSIVLAIPLNLATRVQLALGRGDTAFRWQTVGQLLTLCAIVFLARAGASLPALTAAAVSVPLLGALGNTISLARNQSIATCHSIRKPEILSRLRKDGFLFFSLQLCASVIFSFDLILISATLGPTDAGTYSIVQRLFSIIPVSLSLLWTPLWPAYRSAFATGDHDWVGRTFRIASWLAVLAATGMGIILVAAFHPLMKLWLGSPPPITWILLAGFCVWCTSDAAANSISTLLNAAGIMRPQLIVAFLFAALSVPLKIWGAMEFGLPAVIWVTAILSLFLTVIPFWLMRERLISLSQTKQY